MEKVSTNNDLVDLMTKAHPTATFRQLVNMICSKCANGMVQDTGMKATAAVGSE